MPREAKSVWHCVLYPYRMSGGSPRGLQGPRRCSRGQRNSQDHGDHGSPFHELILPGKHLVFWDPSRDGVLSRGPLGNESPCLHPGRPQRTEAGQGGVGLENRARRARRARQGIRFNSGKILSLCLNIMGLAGLCPGVMGPSKVHHCPVAVTGTWTVHTTLQLLLL